MVGQRHRGANLRLLPAPRPVLESPSRRSRSSADAGRSPRRAYRRWPSDGLNRFWGTDGVGALGPKLLNDKEVVPMGAKAISTEGLSKRYGNVHALESLDLEVAEGEVVGYLALTGRARRPRFACCSG